MTKPRVAAVIAALLLSACGTQNSGAEAANALPADAATTTSAATIDEPNTATAAPPPSTNINDDAQAPAETDQTGIPLLKSTLTKVGQLDGQPITDFKLTAPCTSTISTAAGTKTINWSKVGDWAAHDKDGRTFIDLDDGNGPNTISLPTAPQPEPIGDAFPRTESTFIVLAETCAKQK